MANVKRKKAKRRSPTTADDATGSRAKVADEICKAIATGESIRKLLDGANRPAHWPDRTRFWHWQFEDPKLRATLETALRVRGVVHAEEIEDIAGERPESRQGKFGEEIDPGYVAWQKLRVDARQWMAERMAPGLFGAKVAITGNGAESHDVTARDAKRHLLGRLVAGAAAGRSAPTSGQTE